MFVRTVTKVHFISSQYVSLTLEQHTVAVRTECTVEMSTETKLAGLVILVQALGDCDLKQGCVYNPGVCPLLL